MATKKGTSGKDVLLGSLNLVAMITLRAVVVMIVSMAALTTTP